MLWDRGSSSPVFFAQVLFIRLHQACHLGFLCDQSQARVCHSVIASLGQAAAAGSLTLGVRLPPMRNVLLAALQEELDV